MTYQELLDAGKAVFNFHSDEPFVSTEQILAHARKIYMPRDAYTAGVLAFSGYLTRYADCNKKEGKE